MIVFLTTLVIAVVGAAVGFGLVYTGKKFHVEVDERETAVRECLPGNNCGACGFAGCDAMAAAIVSGAAPVNGCPVGGAPVASRIAQIMGTMADVKERNVAFVQCKGSCKVTRNQGNYIGVQDCRTAVLSGLTVTECSYGCLGFGSCVVACPHDAIHVRDGVSVVDPRKCIGCGLCAKACPRKLIVLIPESRHVAVQCSNRDKGPIVKKVCSAGCIGCGMCQRTCEHDAIRVTDNLACVAYENCVQCGACAEKCPVKVITLPLGQVKKNIPA
ncbi:MAG: RnfABCDGE type electron transport complex subunit B [Oscillospiraceae bacterium]|nr:RnfABCDGE type electron transport complex subunit B [Oscillospiraceae bacterium]